MRQNIRLKGPFPLTVKRADVFMVAEMVTGIAKERQTFEWAWQVFQHRLKAVCRARGFRYGKYTTMWTLVKVEPFVRMPWED